VSKKLLLVEGKTDKAFIEVLLKKIDQKEIFEIRSLEGFTNLEKELTTQIRPDEYGQIGIMIDADEDIQERLNYVNNVLSKISDDIVLQQLNCLRKSKKLKIDFACYITNIDNKGNLETILKKIASSDKFHAECLNIWFKCLEEKGKNFTTSEQNKLWVQIYQRYDTCNDNEAENASKKCSGKAAFEKPIWNFEHDALNDLKTFLELFKDA